MYLYGGFNGQTKSDLVRFVPGGCSHVKTEAECVASRAGGKCGWNMRKETCELWQQGTAGGKKSQVEVRVMSRIYFCTFLYCRYAGRATCEIALLSVQLRYNTIMFCAVLYCGIQSSCRSCLATTSSCLWCSDGCHAHHCSRAKDLKQVTSSSLGL